MPKFFNKYLPLALSVILVVTAVFAYEIYNSEKTYANSISLDNDTTTSFSGASTSFAYTVSGTNTFIAVECVSASLQCQTVTYNSVSLTDQGNVSTANGTNVSLWTLVGPTTGSNTVAITGAGGTVYVSVISYDGVSQTGNPVQSTTGSLASGGQVTPLVMNLTTQHANDWLLLAQANSFSAAMTISPGTERISFSGSADGMAYGDYGPIVTPASTNVDVNTTQFGDSNSMATVMTEIQPASSTGTAVATSTRVSIVNGRLSIQNNRTIIPGN